MSRLSDRQFKLFKDTFKHYMEVMNLNDWMVKFVKDSDLTCYANIQTNHEYKTAVVGVCSSGGFHDDEFLKQTARHECGHLLIGDFAHYAHSRYTKASDLYHHEEALVNKVSSLLKKLDDSQEKE